MNDKQRTLIDYFNRLPDPAPPPVAAPGGGVEEGALERPPAPATAEVILERLGRRVSAADVDAALGAEGDRDDWGGLGGVVTQSGRRRRRLPPSERPIPGRVLDVAAQAVEKARNDEALSPAEEVVLEQIILVDQRPVLDVIDGDISTPPAGWEFLDQFRARIRAVMPSIGRIDVPGLFTLPFAGTGIVVGDGLLLTNRHVADIFVDGVGAGATFLSFRSQFGTCFDPQYEVADPDPGAGGDRYEVTEALLVHPHWDAALLRVKAVDGAVLPPALPLARRPPAFFGSGAKRNVVVIGYPEFDHFTNNAAEQMNVFRGIFGRKRAAPGFLSGFADVKSKYGMTVRAAKHDASTLGGNSGSAVVDLTSGIVLALHFGGMYLKANYGVPTWELARDHHVTDLGVPFADLPDAESGAGATVPAWMSAWEGVQPLVPNGAPPVPAGPGGPGAPAGPVG